MTTEPDLTPFLGKESPPIHFPNGLVGLEDWKEFAIVSHPEGGDLRLLQSLQDNRMSLIVVDPRQIDPTFKISLNETDVQALEFSGDYQSSFPEGLEVYCILSVQEEPFYVTANMLGPLVINPETGLGRQIIQANSNYNSRYPVAGSETGTGGK